jgi:hypothetical protein
MLDPPSIASEQEGYRIHLERQVRSTRSRDSTSATRPRVGAGPGRFGTRLPEQHALSARSVIDGASRRRLNADMRRRRATLVVVDDISSDRSTTKP